MPSSSLSSKPVGAGPPRASWWSREGAVAAAVTAAVVCVRVGMGWRNGFCGTPDACNYLGVAQSLGSCRGFQARFLFDLQQDTLALPTRAIEYWRPGTSFFLLLARPFGTVTLHSSMVVTVLAIVALAAAAWVLALRATGSRRVALASYLLCFLLPPAWSESMTPDSGMFYGLAVAWFLVLFAVRRRGGVGQDVAALLFVALTYAIRNDGVLLLLPLLAILWQRRRLGLPGGSLPYALAMLAGFALALAPMHLLNKAVLGQAFPSGAGRALYVDSFDSFMQYRQPVNLHTLLATGAAHLLKVRVTTFASVVYRNLALSVGFAVVFLPALFVRERGAVQKRETTLPELTGGVAFLAAVLGMYTLVMPVIGEFSALRAFYGLLPLVSVLAVVSVARLVPDKRMAGVVMASVLAAYAVAGVMADRRELTELAGVGDPMRTLGEELRAVGVQPDRAVLMTQNPVQTSVTTGFATVAMPSNGEAAMRGLADELKVTDVLVNAGYSAAQTERMRAALAPVGEVMLPKSHVLVLRLRAR